MAYKNSEYSNVLPGYLENSLKKQPPFYHTDLGNTLEGITLKATPEKGKGVLEKIFSDKATTLKATAKALLDEITLRETLDSHFLNKIDDEICSHHTDLMQLGNVKTHYAPLDLSKEITKRKAQLENNVLELEKQKRTEYLECWRDLMSLKKYLLTSLKDYWDLVKKREVLSSDLS